MASPRLAWRLLRRIAAANRRASAAQAVRDFWDVHPWGSEASHASRRRAYFNEVRRKRYAAEGHIHLVARFAEFRDRDVLEIGCGLGTDGLEFARHGAHYTGIDVSPRSVELGREQLTLFGADFADVHTDVWFFNAAHWPLLGRLAREKSRQALARNFGWHRMVYGCKAV